MRHHYIPQFYLRPWLGSDHKLQEFRRGYQGRIQSGRYGTESTGCAEDLYRLPGATKETEQSVERIFMGAVDDTAKPARDLLLRGVIPQGTMRASWARFLLSLVIRTPEQIAAFKRKVMDHWRTPSLDLRDRYARERRPHWPARFEDLTLHADPDFVDRTAILTAAQMMERENVLSLLMSAAWWVLDISSSCRHFLTSDHPLVMTNGLGRPDGHFGLAISPTKLFVGFMQPDFGMMFRAVDQDTIVSESNLAVIGQGRKYVYAVDNAEFELVKSQMGTRDYMTFFPENG